MFRTTYYFRTFDYCVARELKNGKFKNVVVPLTDSLYRFRMTGKSNSLLSDVKFESGTLRAWEIDPFGARVEYDPELRRHRVISPREADADARRAAIKRDLNEMLEMYDRIAERNADPNDQGALAAANRTKRQENDNAVLGKLSTALQGKIDELASVASGPDEADFTMGPTSPPLTTAQRAEILKTEVARVITAMLPKASSGDVATIMANYGDPEAMLLTGDPTRPGYVERVVREVFDKAYETPATRTAIQTAMGGAKENTAQAAVTTLAKQKSTLLDLVEKNVSALWSAGGLAPSIQCPADAPVQRGFQVLGPEGWRTFNQDERLLVAMSSSAAPIVSTLKDLSGRVLNARDNPEAELLRSRLSRNAYPRPDGPWIGKSATTKKARGSSPRPFATNSWAGPRPWPPPMPSARRSAAMKRIRTPRPMRLALSVLALSALAGCAADSTGSSRNSQISVLDASASMRVEVEVYKGPLSKEMSIQFAELAGVLDDSKRGLEILHANMTVSAARLGCAIGDGSTSGGNKGMLSNQPARSTRELTSQGDMTLWSTLFKPKPKDRTVLNYENAVKLPGGSGEYLVDILKDEGVPDRNGYIFCNTLAQILIDTEDTFSAFPKNHNSFHTNCPKIHAPSTPGTNHGQCVRGLQDIAEFGARLAQRAEYWATEHVATMPDNTRLRIEMANFAQFVKNYGNQLVSRANALVKQVAGARGVGIARQQLANSVFLRDSSPTGYLNLYRWNKAAVDREEDGVTVEDRTRMVDQLVADTYWSKVNTVFAAGQGDVSMALIKDDVGNWNLKSFDNSPGELLNAYKDAGLAAVKSAVELAGSGGTLPRAKNALNFANQIALGSTSGGRAAETADRLATLREETARKIAAIGDDMEEVGNDLDKDITELKEKINGADGKSGLQKERDDQREALKNENEAVGKIEGQLKDTGEKLDTSEKKIAELNDKLAKLAAPNPPIPPKIIETVTDSDGTARTVETDNPAYGPHIEEIKKTDKALDDEVKKFTGLRKTEKELAGKLTKKKEDVATKRKDLEKVEKALSDAKGELAIAESDREDLNKETASKIEQVLDLHAALVGRLAEAAVEAAGATAPKLSN